MKASIKKHFFRFNNGPDTLFQILVFIILTESLTVCGNRLT